MSLFETFNNRSQVVPSLPSHLLTNVVWCYKSKQDALEPPLQCFGPVLAKPLLDACKTNTVQVLSSFDEIVSASSPGLLYI